MARSPTIYDLTLGKAARGCLLQQVEPSYLKKVHSNCLITAWRVCSKIYKLMYIKCYSRYTPFW